MQLDPNKGKIFQYNFHFEASQFSFHCCAIMKEPAGTEMNRPSYSCAISHLWIGKGERKENAESAGYISS